MAQELTIFKNGLTQRSSVFDAIKGEHGALSAGVGPGFARITYKGGKWGLKYQGETRMFRRYIYNNGSQIDDGPNPKLDVVILKVAEKASKYFYIGAYSEGDMNPPDCWSTNGIVPDAGAPKKQSQTCAGCPNNAWGSAKPRNDGTPSRGKACTDHKRLVVVPAGDIENKAYGGPMLLLVPPTSLKKLAPFEQKLAHAGYRFMEVWSQLTFVEDSAFPIFDFDAVRPLTDDEGHKVIKMRDDPMVERILNVEVEAVEGYDQPEYAAPAQGKPAMADPTPPPVATAPPTPGPMPGAMPDIPPHLDRRPGPTGPVGPGGPPQSAPVVPRETPRETPGPMTAQHHPSGATSDVPVPATDPAALLAALMKAIPPEQLAALMGTAQPEKKRRTRTPPPSPKPTDTTELAGPTLPPPVGPVEAANSNGADEGNGDANIDDIMSKIDNLIPRET
jgi:hypothetical protein